MKVRRIHNRKPTNQTVQVDPPMIFSSAGCWKWRSTTRTQKHEGHPTRIRHPCYFLEFLWEGVVPHRKLSVKKTLSILNTPLQKCSKHTLPTTYSRPSQLMCRNSFQGLVQGCVGYALRGMFGVLLQGEPPYWL